MATPTTTLSALQVVTPVGVTSNTSTLSVDSSVLPLVINADALTTRVEISIYNSSFSDEDFAVINNNGSPANQFTTSVNLTPTVALTNVTILGRNYDPTFNWTPTTLYPVGTRFADPNGNVEVVVVSGTSGAAQPTWSLLAPTTATNVSITNNLLTITANNAYSAGQQLFLTGFETATFLNGQVITVNGTGPFTFTAAFPHADYVSAADLGTIQSVTSDNGTLWAAIGGIAVTPTIKFGLLFTQTGLAVAIAPPSGLSANKNTTTCQLQWVTPDFPGFIGVRVMISTDPAGINPPYAQFGDLITAVSSTSQSIIRSTSTTSNNVPIALITNVALQNNLLTVQAVNSFVQGTVVEVIDLVNATFLNGETVTVMSSTSTSFTAAFTGQNYTSTPDNGIATSIVSTQTTTNVNTVMTVDFSSVEIPASLINNPIFYAMFSTVIQDPTTNALFESVQNGPLTAGFVNLQLTNPTDFPVLQRKEDIAGRLISQILRQQPDLDLSPRSEIRDMFVDPMSIEASNMSVREWFARISQSISAISQIDDANGDGVSDSFASSPYKQQIARAYGLSPDDTQNLINEQFDILGEQAGLTRLPAATSTVTVTFYTFQQPTQSIVVPQGAVVGTAQDSNTPAVNFTTTGQAVIDVSNLASFFNPQTGWWGVSVPAQCTTSGSVGNVGAGTIRQTVSGVPAGLLVTNQVGATFGTDQESNAAFAARIQARLVTGVDSGSRHGYLVQALSTPGIIDAEVVAAGDLFMLRDWDPTRQKHVFGAVDIYTRGTTLSEQDEFVPFVYANNGQYGIFPSYSNLLFLGGMTFQIQSFGSLANLPYDGVELVVSRSNNTFYLSLDRAQFNNSSGFIILNPADPAYQYVGNSITKAKVPLLINNVPASNQTAIASISGAQINTYTFQLFIREKSPFSFEPALQPVIEVFSVTGSATGTGIIPQADVALIHTSDFLLNGGSNNAGDTVQINLVSSVVTSTIAASTTAPVLIDIGMDQPLDALGNPLNVLSVRSLDQSTLYQYNVDYNIITFGPYHQYALNVLTSSVGLTALSLTSDVITVTVPNDFGIGASVTFSGITDPSWTFLNGQIVVIGTASPTQFTANFSNPNIVLTAVTGIVTGSAIQNAQSVLVSYNKFVLYERPTLIVQEQQVLNGTLPTTLNNDGFVHNTWLPESYSTGIPSLPLGSPNSTYLALTLDGWDGLFGGDGGLDVLGSTGLVGAQIAHDSRYIKVTINNGITDVVMKENIDFTLTVDSISGAATIARILTGQIPDGGTIKVTYFVTETFTFSTEYPTFVEILANQIAKTKHAAADVLVKAMVANPVDITMTVNLKANTAPETIDPVIRTVINIVLDNAQGTLYQSELIGQVQAVSGVQNVQVPLLKCAKSDGSYDIGVIIPTATSWTRLGSDPAFAGVTVPVNSWITTNRVLPDSTIPSGGEATAIVDFLYQGQAFIRATSITNFLQDPLTEPHLAVAPGVVNAPPGSFYIIGDNDAIIPATITATSIASSVLTVTAVNTFNVGQLVELRGTAESFLNGQDVVITSIIKNNSNIQTGFTATFMEGNFTNTTDTGIVGVPESYAQKVIVTIPADVPNPGNLSYFVTYQVFNEGGAKDVTVSPTEFLAPGRISISYVTTTG